jgi:hypothetical protein
MDDAVQVIEKKGHIASSCASRVKSVGDMCASGSVTSARGSVFGRKDCIKVLTDLSRARGAVWALAWGIHAGWSTTDLSLREKGLRG